MLPKEWQKLEWIRHSSGSEASSMGPIFHGACLLWPYLRGKVTFLEMTFIHMYQDLTEVAYPKINTNIVDLQPESQILGKQFRKFANYWFYGLNIYIFTKSKTKFLGSPHFLPIFFIFLAWASMLKFHSFLQTECSFNRERACKIFRIGRSSIPAICLWKNWTVQQKLVQYNMNTYVLWQSTK